MILETDYVCGGGRTTLVEGCVLYNCSEDCSTFPCVPSLSLLFCQVRMPDTSDTLCGVGQEACVNVIGVVLSSAVGMWG